MFRRLFLAGATLASLPRRAPGQQVVSDGVATSAEVFVERAQQGKPYPGKVLAAIQPHSDDVPIFAGGTVAKLVDEGYAGYLIRVTNDDMAGPGSIGNTVLENERDTQNVAHALGLRKVFNLN